MCLKRVFWDGRRRLSCDMGSQVLSSSTWIRSAALFSPGGVKCEYAGGTQTWNQLCSSFIKWMDSTYWHTFCYQGLSWMHRHEFLKQPQHHRMKTHIATYSRVAAEDENKSDSIWSFINLFNCSYIIDIFFTISRSHTSLGACFAFIHWKVFQMQESTVHFLLPS